MAIELTPAERSAIAPLAAQHAASQDAARVARQRAAVVELAAASAERDRRIPPLRDALDRANTAQHEAEATALKAAETARLAAVECRFAVVALDAREQRARGELQEEAAPQLIAAVRQWGRDLSMAPQVQSSETVPERGPFGRHREVSHTSPPVETIRAYTAALRAAHDAAEQLLDVPLSAAEITERLAALTIPPRP